jgi:hypothetical protein
MGGGAGVDVGSDAGTDADAGGGGGCTDDPAGTDWTLFEAILSGALPAAAGLIQIAHSGGLPIDTPEGFVFARLDDGAGPYQLAGDFNGWQPAEMQSQAGIYWTRVEIADPIGDKYKLVDGSGTFLADPLARRYGYDEYGEHSLVAASGAHLERFPEVSAASVAARSVRVWVPASTPQRHLYVHDGQNLFDPNAPFGGWKLEQSVSDSTLVVGIDNTAARMDEYTHVADVIAGSSVGGEAELYAAFVLDVVRPLVEARYCATSSRGTLGSSLGGLVAFFQATRDPGAWQFAASMSGTFGWGSIGANNTTLIEQFASAGKLPLVLYLDSGGGPGSGCVDSDGDGIEDDSPDAEDNYCETGQMRQTLEQLGYVTDSELFHWWEPDAAHNEAAWAARVWRPVQRFEAL